MRMLAGNRQEERLHTRAEALHERVAVTPPYYALGSLDSPAPGIVFADVPRQQPLGSEVGPMAAAEMARHLSLAGSLAAASLHARPGRHHYLAHRARFRRVAPAGPAARELRARASASEPPRRRARAESALADADGNVVARAELEYLVVPPRVFARLFGDQRVASLSSVSSGVPCPHAAPLSLHIDKIGAGARRGWLTVEPGSCAGHFDGYPALPVTHLLTPMVALASEIGAARRRRPSVRYRVEAGELEAYRLAFAGSIVTISVLARCTRGEEDDFSCVAANQKGDRLVHVNLTLRTAV